MSQLNKPNRSQQFLHNDFDVQLPNMLNHILDGELKKGKYYGIHFYRDQHHQIQEVTKLPTQNGIWEAKIKIQHHRTKAWVKKEKASTFFPLSWQQDELVEKLKEAYVCRKKIFSYKHIGHTSCGIKIAFFFRNNNVVSCFPIYPIFQQKEDLK
jgi:hypothetical protein